MFENLTMEQIFELFPEDTQDLQDELFDPRFGNRKHGSRGTHAVGCTGPICKKGERDRSRIRNERTAARRGREYNPYVRQYDRDALIDAAAKWGEMELLKRRLAALESA